MHSPATHTLWACTYICDRCSSCAGSVLGTGIERPGQPVQRLTLQGHHVKAAGRRQPPAQQVMAGRQHEAFLLAHPHAGRSTAMCGAGTLAHLDKDHGPVTGLHDQVDLAATAPGRPIIALQQAQARGLQVLQGPVLGRSPRLTGAAAQSCQLLEEPH